MIEKSLFIDITEYFVLNYILFLNLKQLISINLTYKFSYKESDHI